MRRLWFLHIHVEKVIPKRREALISVIGNSFASASPFQNLPWIEDKTSEKISFHSAGFLSGPLFRSAGELKLMDEGVKTRLEVSMNLLGLLVLIYLLHWIPVLLFWFFQGLWAALVNPETVRLLQGWVVAALLIWPGFVFIFMRRRIKLRMMAYVNNLVFHT